MQDAAKSAVEKGTGAVKNVTDKGGDQPPQTLRAYGETLRIRRRSTTAGPGVAARLGSLRYKEWLTVHRVWRSKLPETLDKGTVVESILEVMGMPNRIRWTIVHFKPPRR